MWPRIRNRIEVLFFWLQRWMTFSICLFFHPKRSVHKQYCPERVQHQQDLEKQGGWEGSQWLREVGIHSRLFILTCGEANLESSGFSGLRLFLETTTCTAVRLLCPPRIPMRAFPRPGTLTRRHFCPIWLRRQERRGLTTPDIPCLRVCRWASPSPKERGRPGQVNPELSYLFFH